MDMARQTRMWVFVAAGLAAAAGSARAVDPWEGGFGDDGPGVATLTHGSVQQHDLDTAGGPADVDWLVVSTVAGRSYEARISDHNVRFNRNACATCAQFVRLASDGTTVAQNDQPVVAVGPGSYDRTIRWIATTTEPLEYIRVTGDTAFAGNASSVYRLRFWDTTYAIPRWNAANGQTTVFLIQNAIAANVSGVVRLHLPDGTLVHEHPFDLGPNRLEVWNAGTVPALVGQSGHAYVVHNAGYGGLSGKAVALEPATGFSFDTLMQPMPN